MINVISLHGVRSRQKNNWQDEFGKYIKDCGRNDINYIPFKYGWIPAIFCTIPFIRKHYIKKLKKWLKHNFSFLYQANNIVVCHSFGTYLAFHALKQIDWIKIDKLILFGSILHCREDFKDIVPDTIKNIINFHSLEDEVCKYNPLGHAGHWGFRNKNTKTTKWHRTPYTRKRIINRRLFLAEHTEYFPKRFSDILKLIKKGK